jgi:hypothetical protein
LLVVPVVWLDDMGPVAAGRMVGQTEERGVVELGGAVLAEDVFVCLVEFAFVADWEAVVFALPKLRE